MWNEMLVMGIPLWEKVVRTVTVYLVVVLLLRTIGRRDLAQLTTFDLVVVLLLSNVVQNAIIGPDNSLTGGLVGAVVLLVASAILTRVGTATDTTERILQGTPVTVARDGMFLRDALRRLGVRATDLKAALREQGAGSVSVVDRAELMPSGTLVVELREDAQPATQADVQRLLDRIDALETALQQAVSGRGRQDPRPT
jgi:uncharacterized membrane protein YcaP (DUF421 family)